MRAVVSEPGEVIELSREQSSAWCRPTGGERRPDAGVHHRRMELIATGVGDVMLIGSAHSAGTLRARGSRAQWPSVSIRGSGSRADLQQLLDRFNIQVADVPVLICRETLVLRNPTNQQIADCLGFNDNIDPRRYAI